MIKIINERPIEDFYGNPAIELKVFDSECEKNPCGHCAYKNWNNHRHEKTTCLEAHSCSFLDSYFFLIVPAWK